MGKLSFKISTMNDSTDKSGAFTERKLKRFFVFYISFIATFSNTSIFRRNIKMYGKIHHQHRKTWLNSFLVDGIIKFLLALDIRSFDIGPVLPENHWHTLTSYTKVPYIPTHKKDFEVVYVR